MSDSDFEILKKGLVGKRIRIGTKESGIIIVLKDIIDWSDDRILVFDFNGLEYQVGVEELIRYAKANKDDPQRGIIDGLERLRPIIKAETLASGGKWEECYGECDSLYRYNGILAERSVKYHACFYVAALYTLRSLIVRGDVNAIEPTARNLSEITGEEDERRKSSFFGFAARELCGNPRMLQALAQRLSKDGEKGAMQKLLSFIHIGALTPINANKADGDKSPIYFAGEISIGGEQGTA